MFIVKSDLTLPVRPDAAVVIAPKLADALAMRLRVSLMADGLIVLPRGGLQSALVEAISQSFSQTTVPAQDLGSYKPVVDIAAGLSDRGLSFARKCLRLADILTRYADLRFNNMNDKVLADLISEETSIGLIVPKAEQNVTEADVGPYQQLLRSAWYSATDAAILSTTVVLSNQPWYSTLLAVLPVLGPLANANLSGDAQVLGPTAAAWVAARIITSCTEMQFVSNAGAKDKEANLAAASSLKLAACLALVPGVTAMFGEAQFQLSLLRHPLVAAAMTGTQALKDAEMLLSRAQAYDGLDITGMRTGAEGLWQGRSSDFAGNAVEEYFLPADLFNHVAQLTVGDRAVETLTVPPMPDLTELSIAGAMRTGVATLLAPSDVGSANSWLAAMRARIPALIQRAGAALDKLEADPRVRVILSNGVLVQPTLVNLQAKLADMGAYSAVSLNDNIPAVVGDGTAEADTDTDPALLHVRALIPARIRHKPVAVLAHLSMMYANNISNRLLAMGSTPASPRGTDPFVVATVPQAEVHKHWITMVLPDEMFQLWPSAYGQSELSNVAPTLDRQGIATLLGGGADATLPVADRVLLDLEAAVTEDGAPLADLVQSSRRLATALHPIGGLLVSEAGPLTHESIAKFLGLVKGGRPPNIRWVDGIGRYGTAFAGVSLTQARAGELFSFASRPALEAATHFIDTRQRFAFIRYAKVPVPVALDSAGVMMAPAVAPDAIGAPQFADRVGPVVWLDNPGIVRLPSVDNRTHTLVSLAAGKRSVGTRVLMLGAMDSTRMLMRVLGVAYNTALVMNIYDTKLPMHGPLTEWRLQRVRRKEDVVIKPESLTEIGRAHV